MRKQEQQIGGPMARLVRVLAVGVSSVSLPFLGPVWATQRQFLHGHVPAVAARLHPVGHLPATERLRLAIGLPLRNRQALDTRLQQVYDPTSPQYHQYVTPEKFVEMFSPTEQDYQAVREFVKSQGLEETGTHPNRTLLDVTGSVANIEKAFHVTMRVYQHPQGDRVFYAPDVEPSVELATGLLAISGLDNYVLPHRATRSAATSLDGDATNSAGGSGPPELGAPYIGNDFRHAYVPDARTPWGVDLTGAGQAIGLLQFDGYDRNDITFYQAVAGVPSTRSAMGLPAYVPIVNILLDGSDGTPHSDNGRDEVSMDIEVAIAMAPGLSQVIVYEQPNPLVSPFPSPNDILNRMATDNLARQLTSSWFFNVDANTEQIFQQFALQGQSFFQASGDAGAYVKGITMTAGAGPPADDPYVTSVGGAVLTMTDNGGSWVSETTWNNAGGRSGGGISTSYAIPSWQQGISMSANQGSTTMRNIPDVAMVAANILVASRGTQLVWGGTSAAAPLWAGFAALVNQQVAMLGYPPVGFLNPAIYAIGRGPNYSACFHDITTGNNKWIPGSPDRYSAASGYDLCTGWGSPNGISLVNALAPIPEGLTWVAFENSDPGDGSYARPCNTLARGINAAPAGGTIVIKGAGASAETMTITKSVTIRAAGGPAAIGR